MEQKKTQPGCRAPTHKEAVEICLMALTEQQVKANIAHWRRLYGDGFADAVQQEVIKRYKVKK